MDSTSIKEMDKTKTLQLSKWQKLWHYFLFLIPLCVGIFNLYKLLELRNSENYSGIRTEKGIIISVTVWLSIAIIVFIIKKRRLNFKRIDINLNEIEFKQKMLEISESENWNLTKNTMNYATFYNGSGWTWGLRITVLRFEKYLLINSICDTNSAACISIFSENERNINRMKKNLKKPSG